MNIEKTLNYKWKNKQLLELALTHRSLLNNTEINKSNERLEFLGDAVLELAITRWLYLTYTDKAEGEMTSIRSAIVCRATLAETAETLELGKHIKMSKGEQTTGGANKPAILANTYEAILGSIYLDSSYDTAEQWIQTTLLPLAKEIISKRGHIDAKSHFQEKSQEIHNTTPHYELKEETGEDHNKTFTMTVMIGKKKIATGTGASKKKAEIDAAKNGLLNQKWQ